MLFYSQKRFDKDKNGRLSPKEWMNWYCSPYGPGLQEVLAEQEAAEQARARHAAAFADYVSEIVGQMRGALERLEGERKGQAVRTMRLALYVMSAGLQTQEIDGAVRGTLRAVWARFQPMLGESVYRALCKKRLLFEDVGVIREDRLGSFWRELLDQLPPERRIGRDPDLQQLLDGASRLYDAFRSKETPKADYAGALEPYWAAVRLPEGFQT